MGLKPALVNGWFWSGSEARIPPTNSTQGWAGDWSSTGGSGQRQPDNREFAENGNDESCVAVLNNFYNDGVVWHDVACNTSSPGCVRTPSPSSPSPAAVTETSPKLPVLACLPINLAVLATPLQPRSLSLTLVV